MVTLNRRQLVKFNFRVVEKVFYEETINSISKSAKYYSNLVKDLLKEYKEDIERQELEELIEEGLLDPEDRESVCSLDTFVADRMCAKCFQYELKSLKAIDFPLNTITCDSSFCERSKKPFEKHENFWGCSSCEAYDLCSNCYHNL